MAFTKILVSRKRTTVLQLAGEAGLEADEALIALWYADFPDLEGPADLVPRRDANRARRVLGLATRRELASPAYWQQCFGISPAQFEDMLNRLGVSSDSGRDRLSRRAIHRLQVESRELETLKRGDAIVETTWPPFEWEEIGHARDIRLLTVDEVRAIHGTLVEDFCNAPEPIVPPGVRNEHLLSSAVMRPATSIGDALKYPTIEMAAAALFHSIVHNHPFHNGNKRTALVAMLVFLDENGMLLTCREDALFKLVLQLAQHTLVGGPRSELPDRETLAVAKWLKESVRWVEKGDRVLTWRQLEPILKSYECGFERSGSSVDVRRTVVQRIRYLPMFSKTKELRSQMRFANNGRDIGKSALNKMRRELQLNDEHGVDSSAFYDDAKASTSDFITRYRKTLNRLARL